MALIRGKDLNLISLLTLPSPMHTYKVDYKSVKFIKLENVPIIKSNCLPCFLLFHLYAV